MTHQPVITFRCLMCGWLYEDAPDAPQPNCPKCKSEQRRQVHAVLEEDDPESKVRY